MQSVDTHPDTTVRAETPPDEVFVDEINVAAFNGTGEARLVRALRGTEGALSMVAERNGEVVGHILFTPVRIGNSRPNLSIVGLGPMAVDPAVQRTGVGSTLVDAGLEACRNQGVDAIFVMGHRDDLSGILDLLEGAVELGGAGLGGGKGDRNGDGNSQ